MLIKPPFLSVQSRNGHCGVEIGHPRAVTRETDRYQWECGSERARERERVTDRQTETENSKTLILKDSKVLERERGGERERGERERDDLFI